MRRAISALLLAIGAAACFDSPNYEGRLCTSVDPCPAGYVCDETGRCRNCSDGDCTQPPPPPPPVPPPPPPVCDGTSQGCDDGDACTLSDGCVGTVCVGTNPVICDIPPSECYEPTGTCDSADGSCVYTPKQSSATCEDGNKCTEEDFCEAGDCISGAIKNCDDNNECTDDACDQVNGCTHTNNTAACDDGDACTLGDVCGGGMCRAGIARECNDGNGCTLDSCDRINACSYLPVPDMATCTFTSGGEGVCLNGACVGCAIDADCDDQNVCTDDRCASGTCVNDPNMAPCDDGDPCTHTDLCMAGSCSGTALTCASDPCTTRTCNGTAACAQTRHNGAACADDGNACTNDVCNATGTCTHPYRGDGIQCGANSANRCCGGGCVNIASNTSHCGGCGSACRNGNACESVSATTMCSQHPTGVTGRCRCQGANADCPRGQVCRTVTPYNNRCAPASSGDCASGQVFVDLSSCPNYCRY